MKSRKPSSERNKREEILERDLACLLASTGRIKRKQDLLTVASALKDAEEILGSRKVVAERLGISEEMLREFASVRKLCPFVRQLIKAGKISSIDVAYRLSMLPPEEQEFLARSYVAQEIKGRDVKEIVSFRKRYPRMSIVQALRRVKDSQDVTWYIIRFPLPPRRISLVELRRRLSGLFTDTGIISLDIDANIGTLKITEEGGNKLSTFAKKLGITKRELIHSAVLGKDIR